MDKEYITLKVIKIHQNIGSFFLGKLTPNTLHKIANKNLSRTQDPIYGIQRDIKKNKIKEIKDYLKSHDATFPNTIILAIQNDPIDDYPAYRIAESGDELQIKLEKGIANILDGQHRLDSFDESEINFELPVAIFLDLSLGEQAKIFAKINSTQTKVDLNLVYDLFGISDERTPEKVAYHIVDHLNSEEQSAWKGKIKTLTDKNGDLAQGSMAKFFHKELLVKDEIFKTLYEEQRDTDIKNILLNYFNAVASIFPDEWNNKDKKYILTKTTGFNGFMMFLTKLLKQSKEKKVALSKDYFQDVIYPSKLALGELTSERYESGRVGQNKIKDILLNSLR